MTDIKRLLLIGAILLLTIAFAVPVWAAEVGGGQVAAQAGSVLTVPVNLTDNPGVMGCKLTVRYDPALLTPQSVSRGSLTKDGLLEDSIAVSEPGSFDIVWSDTAQKEGDGTFCTLLFQVLQEKNTEIQFDYSPRDTFNEAFEDVTLTLRPIQVVFAAASITEPVTQAAKEPDAADVAAAVETVLNGKPLSDLTEQEQNELTAQVNDVLKGFGISAQYENFEALRAAYTEAVQQTFVEKSLLAVDGEEIRTALNEALKLAGADTIDALPAEKQAAFVEQAEQALKKLAPDLPTLGSRISTADALAALQTLQSENEAQIAAALPVPVQETPQPKKITYTAPVVIGAAALLTAGGAAATVLHHKKAKKKEESTL